MAVTDLVFHAEVCRKLLTQVERRDPRLAKAFKARVSPIRLQFFRLEEEQGPEAAAAYLNNELRALDLRDLRGRDRTRTRPDDRTLWHRRRPRPS